MRQNTLLHRLVCNIVPGVFACTLVLTSAHAADVPKTMMTKDIPPEITIPDRSRPGSARSNSRTARRPSRPQRRSTRPSRSPAR